MKRTLVVVAAVVGFATAASAGILNVFTTNVSNVAQQSFFVGDTILLKVTGDGQGQASEDSIAGLLEYSGAITNTVSFNHSQYLPAGSGAGACPDAVLCNDGFAYAFSQTGGPVVNFTGTSVITLTATAAGVSQVTWGGTLLDFFGIYSYSSGGLSIPTGASFTINPVIPEPTTAGLVGLGLLGLALGGRRRA
jgi:hypothetical protein